MLKKIIVIFLFLMLFSTLIIPIISGEKITKKVSNNSVKNNYIQKSIILSDSNSSSFKINSYTDAFGYPNDNTPLTVYGLEYYGKRWDIDFQQWNYKFRFDWYQAKRKEPWGDGAGFDEEKYVALQPQLYITESGIVGGSGRDFDQAGWNVQEHNTGDFSSVAEAACSAVIGCFPYVGLEFSYGLELAKALHDHTDNSPEPSYEWLGKQIKEGSGFFKYDCYVKPNKHFVIKWRLHVWASSMDRSYQEYNMEWRAEGDSPPPQEIQVSPPSHNFGRVELEHTERKTFELTNTGTKTVSVYGIYVSGPGFSRSGFRAGYIEPGKTKETYVTFSPNSKGNKYGTLRIDCGDPPEYFITVDLSGRGIEKSKNKIIKSTNIFIQNSRLNSLFEKLICRLYH